MGLHALGRCGHDGIEAAADCTPRETRRWPKPSLDHSRMRQQPARLWPLTGLSFDFFVELLDPLL